MLPLDEIGLTNVSKSGVAQAPTGQKGTYEFLGSGRDNKTI